MYIEAFVEIYNWRFGEQAHKTHRIIELEKYPIFRAQNSFYLDCQQFYKISEVLQTAHIVISNIESNNFYLNDYIDWKQFTQLYDLK